MNRRRQESGYALLAIFMMAAGVALMLYQQLPRVAFESMRAKEEMLIERGEQYQRAIQLYVNVNKKYPQTIEDLEKTGGKRFLRRRYKDPFTGEDEWRIIHVDAMGVLTDSKVQKKEEKKQNQNTFITENPGIGQTQSSGTTGVNVALRRRPSDGAVEGGPAPLALPSSQEPMSQADAFAQFQKQQEALVKQQQQAKQQQGQQGQPGQPVPQGAIPNPLPQGGQPQLGPDGQPLPPNQQQQLNQQGQPMPPPTGQPVPLPMGQPVPVQMGQIPGQVTGQLTMQQAYPNGVPPLAGAPPGQSTYPTAAAQQPGRTNIGTPGTAPNAALDMIRKALTSPSPNIPMAMAPGLQLGPGIAGVASKYEAPSIKVYNEQQDYDRWEFIYDPRKDKRTQQQLAQMGVPPTTVPSPAVPPPVVPPVGVPPFGSPPTGRPGVLPGMQPGMSPVGIGTSQPGFGQQMPPGGIPFPGGRPGGIPFPGTRPGGTAPTQPGSRPGGTTPTQPGGYPQAPGYPGGGIPPPSGYPQPRR